MCQVAKLWELTIHLLLLVVYHLLFENQVLFLRDGGCLNSLGEVKRHLCLFCSVF